MKGCVADSERKEVERKVVSITSKRQITIPQKFYQRLGFTDQAECFVRGNELVLRPARTISGGEFAEVILQELIGEGLSGDDLLEEFKKRQAQIRPAFENMLTESEEVAVGNAEYATYEDVFGTEVKK